MQLKLQNLSCISLFLLLTFSPNSAELSRQASRLAENLGLLLGLPLDVDIPRANASAVPRFLMDVYNCWTSLGATRDRSSCLPVSGRTSKNLNDVNVVRGMKGSAAQSTTEAVFSHSPHQSPLPPSLSLHFNVSMRRVKEDIRYVYTRIPKQALSEKELESVKEQCTGPVSLQLLVKINSSQVGSSLDAFSLLSTARLQPGEIGRKQQVEFSGVTEEFRQWQKEDAESTRQGDMVEMRLIIGGNGESCYDELTPQHLGFRPNTNSYIVVFSKSDDSEEAIIKAGLAELAAEATASRQRRSDETTTDATVTEETGSENGTRPFNISSYHLSSCRRYSHTISFAELGWSDYILQPAEYQANFCAGSCDYPLTGSYNTTKHSYIQSLAAKLNPELVPPPCCAPHELRPVTVIYDQGGEMFVTHEWHGMRAESCGCK